MVLPHSASGQARLGKPVPREQMGAGDLVFFSTYRPGISHVGIYIGDNRFIHAANSRKDVRIDALHGYYAARFRGAKRLLPDPLRFSPEDLRSLISDGNAAGSE
jgi:cell wall-associated NlpC family hydrolase